MSQPQKLRNFPPLKLRLLPTVRQEDKRRPVELWILLVKSFCSVYPFAAALKNGQEGLREEVIWSAHTSTLWAQCKFLWFSTEALWRELLHRQYEILKRFLGTTSKKIFMPTLLSIPQMNSLPCMKAFKLYLYMLFQAWTSLAFLVWWWIITVQAVIWQIFQFLFPYIWK